MEDGLDCWWFYGSYSPKNRQSRWRSGRNSDRYEQLMIKNSADFMKIVAPKVKPDPDWVFGTVIGYGPMGFGYLVQFDGEAATDAIELPFNLAYSPMTGDRVVCHRINGYWYIDTIVTGYADAEIISLTLPTLLPPTAPNRLAVTISDSSSPVSYKNSWADFGGSYDLGGYWMDAMGIVHLQGLVAGGTPSSTSVIFTLPGVLAPEANLIFPATANGVFAQVRVLTTGDVVAYAWGGTGAPSSFSISGITFPSSNSALGN